MDILFPSGDIRNQVMKSEISPKFCFWAAKFLGEDPQISDSLINYSHHRTCGRPKVWWRSAGRD